MKSLKGVLATLTTPFYENGDFALSMLEANVDRYAVSGIHGYLTLTAGGEEKSLSVDEKHTIINCVARRKGKNQTLTAGSFYESTNETIEFARRAEGLGAEYIALLPPSSVSGCLADDALFRYFTDAASSINVPCVLFKAPQYSGGLDINREVIKKCIAHPNITGIIDASSSGIETLICNTPKEFSIISGNADTFLSTLMNGGAGVAATLASSYPVILLDVYDAFVNGDYASLQVLSRKMIRLNGIVTGAYGIASVKYAMEKNGFYGGDPRLPLLPLTGDEKARLDREIEEILA
jgi:4-hydroxy-2-oxoglutarate aldolase